MSLCSLCLSIPFKSLPPPPTDQSEAIGRLQDLFTLRNKNAVPFADPIGFPYHNSLDALATSASTCNLCALVQGEIRAWFDHYRRIATHDKLFIEHDLSTHHPPGNGQALWLTTRYSKAPGFLVLVRSPKTNYHVYVMAGVGFNVETGSFSVMKGRRRFDIDSGSLNSLEIAASWFKDCVNDHADCPEGPTLLPTRILEVGTSGDIKLIDSAGLLGRYACLSYCWGSSRQFTTTRETIEERKHRIDISHVPKTIQDAVTITRHLAINYLWVDSLCICQGDAEDWARESACMTEVYSNACIVVAANHAQDSSAGCFNIRTSRSGCSVDLDGHASYSDAITLHLRDEVYAFFDEFKDEALSHRGWALQERILATRVLHYNTHQMYFECKHGTVGEDGCSTAERYCSIHASDIQSWNQLVYMYYPRLLTKTTDALLAMSGLAKVFGKELGAEYVAGLWSTDLISGLSWQWSYSSKSVPIEYTGPSWSWASCKENPNYASVFCREKDVAEVVGWNVEHKVEGNPYGEVASAWLRVRAPVLSLVLSKIVHTSLDIRLLRAGRTPEPRMCIPGSDSEVGKEVQFDNGHVVESGRWHDWDLEVIILKGIFKNKGQQTFGVSKLSLFLSFWGLVVKKVGNDRQRVGWMFVEGDEGRKAIEDENKWATVDLI